MSGSGMSPEFEKKLEALAKDLHERGAIIRRNPNAERLPFAPYVEAVEANVAKTMAEVLAEHQLFDSWWSPVDGAELKCTCTVIASYDDITETDHEAHARHQAAALSSAGYGLVAGAKREAWDEGALAVMGAHDIGRIDIANPYPYSAAEMRQGRDAES